MKSFDTYAEVEVRVEYNYSKGTPPKYSGSHGNWLPGDPPECSDISIYALISLKAIKAAIEKAEKAGAAIGGMIEVDISGSLETREYDNIQDECQDNANLE